VERGLPEQWRADLAAARAELEGLFADELRRTSESYIGYRRFGIVLIGIGSVLLSVANLI
jgi:hypothetical protein